MTPTLGEILTANARVIAGLAVEEGGIAYVSARLGVVAMLSVLAAQEAETGAAVRVAENRAIAAVLAESAVDYPLVGDDDVTSSDLSLAALDAANAALRRRLIRLHEAVEAAGDTRRDHAILTLYRDMARGRRLTLPG